MRQRKRDWPQRVYCYWACPFDDPLPASVWQQAQAQRALWNRLVWLRAWTAISAQAAPTTIARRVFWQEYQTAARALVATSGLNWVEGPDVLDRFEVSCRTARSMAFHRMPRHRRWLDHVRLVHRYTGGGMPAANLFSTRALRTSIRPIDAGAYADQRRAQRRARVSEGRFGLDDGTIRFRTVLHRPLPAGAIVKRVAFCGQRHPVRGWRWSWQVTIEVPPIHPDHTMTRAACCAGLDLGWCLTEDGEALRLGILVDDGGRMRELTLPLRWSNAHSRRHHLPDGWRDLAVYDQRIARRLEQAKDALRARAAADGIPACVAGTFAHLDRVRQGGLVRMRRALIVSVEQDARHTSVAQADSWRTVLDTWLVENDRLRSLRAALCDRLLARRTWYYRNLARDLCRCYDRIVWEGDLDLKAMAEADDMTPSLAGGMRYRQIACLSDFRRFLREAAAREGTELIDCAVAGTTIACASCDAFAEPGPTRTLTCANGHQWDQDQNAARNLLSQIMPGSAQDSALRSGT